MSVIQASVVSVDRCKWIMNITMVTDPIVLELELDLVELPTLASIMRMIMIVMRVKETLIPPRMLH